MSGKMQWFRWHHGTANDPKWRLVARKSGRPLVEVLSVWAIMLEHASECDPRGSLEGWDHEIAATALEIEPEAVEAIFDAMRGRVHDDDTLTGWSKRQPKREREDTGSGERVKKHREKQRNASVTPRNASVTPCNGLDKIREEEIREEEMHLTVHKTGSNEPEPGARTQQNPSDSEPTPPDPPTADPPKARSGRNGRNPPDDLHRFRSEAAALIREHLWRAKKPPPTATATNSGWAMANELSIWMQLVRSGQYTPEEVNGAISHARRACGFATSEPLTMKIFNVRDRRDRLAVAVQAWRREQEKKNAGSIAEIFRAV